MKALLYLLFIPSISFANIPHCSTVKSALNTSVDRLLMTTQDFLALENLQKDECTRYKAQASALQDVDFSEFADEHYRSGSVANCWRTTDIRCYGSGTSRQCETYETIECEDVPDWDHHYGYDQFKDLQKIVDKARKKANQICSGFFFSKTEIKINQSKRKALESIGESIESWSSLWRENLIGTRPLAQCENSNKKSKSLDDSNEHAAIEHVLSP